MMELFHEQQLTIFNPEQFSLSFTFTKVTSQIFDMVCKYTFEIQRFDSKIQMTTEHFISCPRDSSK